jgi:flagellar assembly protein FliH
VRLNPDDVAAAGERHGEGWAGAHVTVVPDPVVVRGGCLVESDFGYVDAGIDAQLHEVARAILADDAPRTPVAVGREH